jgi:hypothetical protein
VKSIRGRNDGARSERRADGHGERDRTDPLE